ncbi:16937_t:CDS:2 [Dentiscutata heterogama]|uniref:16937_t:CDS:1 n=1 Tax=Dentiscutata heterogama TaxID=1316150 RepID=A0ACA9N0F6_9GLOM|nr:16937_t:CDS:2 [Dentiscutata heterogama]
MAQNKIEDIRDEYTIRIDEKGKEHYKCKAYKKEWAKNITQLQEHINTLSNLTSQEQIELESLLARAFYTSGVSFNVIENIDFQAFLKKACPSFNIPSRHTLSNSLLDKEYMNLQVVVQNTLDETPYHCLVSDGWSNVNKSPMITTPNPIFYKSVCTKEEHHTAENIAKGIENVMREINIDKSILINNSQEISVNSDNQELDINVDDNENEELNRNFTDFSNWLLNTFDNCEHEFDNYSE